MPALDLDHLVLTLKGERYGLGFLRPNRHSLILRPVFFLPCFNRVGPGGEILQIKGPRLFGDVEIGVRDTKT